MNAKIKRASASSPLYGRPRILLCVLSILCVFFLIVALFSAVQFQRGEREHVGHAHTILGHFTDNLSAWIRDICLYAPESILTSGVARAATITTADGSPVLPACRVPVTHLTTTRYLRLIEQYDDQTVWGAIPLASFPDDIARHIIPDTTLAAQAQNDRLAMIHATWRAAATARHAHDDLRARALYRHMQHAYPTETDAHGFPVRLAAALEEHTIASNTLHPTTHAAWLADVRDLDLRAIPEVALATLALVRRSEKMNELPADIAHTRAMLMSFLSPTGIYVYAEGVTNTTPVVGHFWLDPLRTPAWIRDEWIPTRHAHASNSFVHLVAREPAAPATLGEYVTTNIYGATLTVVPFDIARWTARHQWRMGTQMVIATILFLLLLWLSLRVIKVIRAEHLLRKNQLNFVAAVSHELRTPITAVRALAETLNRGILRTPEERTTYTQRIIAESDRLTQLVNNILDVSRAPHRTQRVRMSSVSLASALASAVESAHITAEAKNITMQYHAHATPYIYGTKEILERILYNLLDNAIKYSHPGGVVTTTLTADTRHAHVAISDTGIGIMPQDISRIFERFYRAGDEMTREYPGTGLGLAIVRECVHALGGDVDVTSDYGKGSTFRVHLHRYEKDDDILSSET